MNVEILCTGDEILTGKTVNTNYSFMARRLGDVGLTVSWGTTVGDDRTSLMNAFAQAAERADAVIVNGGLGPTVDDLSQEVAAAAARVKLELHEAWLEQMEAWYARRGRVMPSNNRKQAMLPVGAEFIDNPIGTACGFAVDIGKARFFFTPGVPREMRRMIDEQIVPRLLEISGVKVVTRLKRFHSFGIGESRADQLLSGIEEMTPDGSIKLGFQAHYPQLEVKLAVQAPSVEELEEKLAPVTEAVRNLLGNAIVAEDDESLEHNVLVALAKNNATLATMEMFTAGSIAARLVPGDGFETVVKCGVVSRDISQLAAAAQVSLSNQNVGAATAQTLAAGLRVASGANYALAVLMTLDTGEDGLGFGADVFIAIAAPEQTAVRQARLVGGREWVRLGAIEMSLDCLRRHLQGLPIDEKIDFEKH